MVKLRFSKMHGLGNDFMVVNGVNQPFQFSPAQIKAWGNRHTGVGFDQLLIVAPSHNPETDFDYIIYNQDGSRAEQCGNGARCVAKFIEKEKLSAKKELKLLTQNKITQVNIEKNGLITVKMTEPYFEPKQIPFKTTVSGQTYTLKVNGRPITFSVVGVGNPHAVIIVDEIHDQVVEEIGSRLSVHPDFPEGINVNFMQMDNSEHVRLTVYERGSGLTLACGSGACATVAAGQRLGLLAKEVRVSQPGGDLWISWPGPGFPISMRGPAEFVYDGELGYNVRP